MSFSLMLVRDSLQHHAISMLVARDFPVDHVEVYDALLRHAPLRHVLSPDALLPRALLRRELLRHVLLRFALP